ncbi:conserved hypothetical protein [Culex quinquefasciatus]|uniref:Uncharacterized protein n=1 Tax=Culex quinquefasciatus TaxID=7176 RepID=B0WJN7_CULQU|nr:conserved hypothetical protein [Culex quinquefasciatus]|eukprot:XP_001848921.1 conserved hypothetical protein [Culex quinquefasciatus]
MLHERVQVRLTKTDPRTCQSQAVQRRFSDKLQNHVNEYDAGTDLPRRHQHESAAELEPEKAVLLATRRSETSTGITTITGSAEAKERLKLRREEDQRRKMERKQVAARKLQELDKCNLAAQLKRHQHQDHNHHICRRSRRLSCGGQHELAGRPSIREDELEQHEVVKSAEKVIDPSLGGQHSRERSQEHAKVGDGDLSRLIRYQSESLDGSGRPSSFLTESVAVSKTVAGKIWPNANKKILQRLRASCRLSNISGIGTSHDSYNDDMQHYQERSVTKIKKKAKKMPRRPWITKTKPVGNQAVPGHQPCADTIVCVSRRKFRIAAANVGWSKIVRRPRQSAKGGRQRNLHRNHEGHWRDSSLAVALFMNPAIVVQRPIIQDEKRIEAITKNDEFDFN